MGGWLSYDNCLVIDWFHCGVVLNYKLLISKDNTGSDTDGDTVEDDQSLADLIFR